MTFQSPISLSLALAASAGQFMRQLPSQADLLDSLSLSHVYRVMPLASVRMPPVTFTLAGMVWAMAKPPTAAATTRAGAITLISFIGVSSNVSSLWSWTPGAGAPHWTGADVNIISRLQAMASQGHYWAWIQG